MKILNPGMVQTIVYEDMKTGHLMYNFSIKFETSVVVDLALMECDPIKARAIAKTLALDSLGKEIGKHVSTD